MEVSNSDLATAVAGMAYRAAALERLVLEIVRQVPELRAIVQKMPDPQLQGIEFVGRRLSGVAGVGTAVDHGCLDAWHALVSRI